jgi:hypothetical protein
MGGDAISEQPRWANAFILMDWANMATGDPGRRLIFYPSEAVDVLQKPYPQDRRVHTEQELRSAVQESGLPAYRVWIHERLEEEAQRLWEESSAA